MDLLSQLEADLLFVGRGGGSGVFAVVLLTPLVLLLSLFAAFEVVERSLLFPPDLSPAERARRFGGTGGAGEDVGGGFEAGVDGIAFAVVAAAFVSDELMSVSGLSLSSSFLMFFRMLFVSGGVEALGFPAFFLETCCCICCCWPSSLLICCFVVGSAVIAAAFLFVTGSGSLCLFGVVALLAFLGGTLAAAASFSQKTLARFFCGGGVDFSEEAELLLLTTVDLVLAVDAASPPTPVKSVSVVRPPMLLLQERERMREREEREREGEREREREMDRHQKSEVSIGWRESEIPRKK